MKKNILVLFAFLIYFSTNAQEAVETTKASNDSSKVSGDTYNRWTIEASVGNGKGIRPYAPGYFQSAPQKYFGGLQPNSFVVGARYMINPIFGVRLDFGYDTFENQNGSASLDFKMTQYKGRLQGVVNLARLFKLEDKIGRFGLLSHAGVQVARMKSETADDATHVKGQTEDNGGVLIGFTPQFRILKPLAIYFDFTMVANFRQHMNWDGSFADDSNNLAGQSIFGSIGLSYSFGKETMHGDWAVIEDRMKKELEDLKNRVDGIEKSMDDDDKDGVANYLDEEKNSLPNSVVNTKGVMVDKDKNGVPDSVEQYVTNAINNNNNTYNNSNINNSTAAQLINDGYVYAYFDFDVRQPNISSTDNIGFILNYLKQNPDKSIDIIGYADELGTSDYNDKLSSDRAENVKAMLVDAGIDASRLNVSGNGVDNSVNKNNEYSRRLVRKVMFKIKK